jgi:general stress protein 26
MDTQPQIETDYERNVQKLKDLISGTKVAMLTTLNSDGTFHSRPMWTQQSDFDGNLWFFTRSHSPKALELQKDHHVTVTYADPEDGCYIAVTGQGEVVQDRKKAEQLWNPIYQAWFPKGLDDPGIALIRVKVDKAEYWDTPSSQVVQLVGFVPGKKDEHGKMKLTG